MEKSAFISLILLSFTLFTIPGLWGAPLKSISAFLPPQATQDFDLYTSSFGTRRTHDGKAGKVRRYSDIFHAPLNLDVSYDYEEGIALAKMVGKPVMLDFTGHACVNCRKMEASVWPDKDVYKLLHDELVIIQLYVDDKTALPEEEQVYIIIQRKKNPNHWKQSGAIFRRANSIQIRNRYYVLLNPVDEEILVKPIGAEYEPKSYYNFLQSAINQYRK